MVKEYGGHLPERLRPIENIGSEGGPLPVVPGKTNARGGHTPSDNKLFRANARSFVSHPNDERRCFSYYSFPKCGMV